MQPPSSTSSSESGSTVATATPRLLRRLPIAAFGALALVVIVERMALAPGANWEMLRAAIPADASTVLDRGLAMDQDELGRLEHAGANKSRVVVMGSSRANAAFDQSWVPEAERSRLAFAKLAHAGIGPFELRVMVEEVLPRRPAAVVILLSEFDTHRSFSLMPHGLPFRGPAILDLARQIEGRFFFQQRTRFLRMVGARLSLIYRFREILRLGVLGDPLSFDLAGGHLAMPRVQGGGWVGRDWRGAQTSGSPAAIESLVSAARSVLPNLPDAHLRAQARQIISIGVGPDVEIQEALLRATFARLRSHGAHVLVVEGPVHPVAAGFVDARARREFDLFADEVERQLGVHVLRSEDTGPFGVEDFQDLTHLHGRAGRPLTQKVVEEILALLESRRDRS